MHLGKQQRITQVLGLPALTWENGKPGRSSCLLALACLESEPENERMRDLSLSFLPVSVALVVVVVVLRITHKSGAESLKAGQKSSGLAFPGTHGAGDLTLWGSTPVLFPVCPYRQG